MVLRATECWVVFIWCGIVCLMSVSGVLGATCTDSMVSGKRDLLDRYIITTRFIPVCASRSSSEPYDEVETLRKG